MAEKEPLRRPTPSEILGAAAPIKEKALLPELPSCQKSP
jgi:hypothetical protein